MSKLSPLNSFVIAGLDPAIHLAVADEKMVARIKSAHDGCNTDAKARAPRVAAE